MEFNYTEWHTNVTEAVQGIPDIEYYTFIVLFIGLTIILGNAITLLTIKVNPSFRTTPDMYLVSLSTADLMIGVAIILSISFNTSFMYLERSGLVYKCVCLTSLCLASASRMASVSSLALMSLDRCMAVSHPFIYRSHDVRKRTRLLLLGSWMCCFFYGLVIVYDNRFTTHTLCTFVTQTEVWYRRYVTSSLILGFLGTSVVCYIQIARVYLNRSKNKLKAISKNSSENRKYGTKSKYTHVKAGRTSGFYQSRHKAMVYNSSLIQKDNNIQEMSNKKFLGKRKSESNEQKMKRENNNFSFRHLYKEKSASYDVLNSGMSDDLGPIVKSQSSVLPSSSTPVSKFNQGNETLYTSLDFKKDLYNFRTLGFESLTLSSKCMTQEQSVLFQPTQSNIPDVCDIKLKYHEDFTENSQFQSLFKSNGSAPSLTHNVSIENLTNQIQHLSFQHCLYSSTFLTSQDFLHPKSLSEQNVNLLSKSNNTLYHTKLSHGHMETSSESELWSNDKLKRQSGINEDAMKQLIANQIVGSSFTSLPNSLIHPNIQQTVHDNLEIDKHKSLSLHFDVERTFSTKFQCSKQCQCLRELKRHVSETCFQSLKQKLSSSSCSSISYDNQFPEKTPNAASTAEIPAIKSQQQLNLIPQVLISEREDKTQNEFVRDKQQDERDEIDLITYNVKTCPDLSRDVYINISGDSSTAIESTLEHNVFNGANFEEVSQGDKSQNCFTRKSFSISNIHQIRSEPTIARNAVAKDMSRKSRNVIKMIFVTQMIFGVCILPSTAIFICYGLVPIPRWMVTICNVLGCLNSVVNIFVYVGFSKIYRKAIWDVLRCRFNA